MAEVVNWNSSRLTESHTRYPMMRKLNILANPSPLSGKPLKINNVIGIAINHPSSITSSQAKTGNLFFQLFLSNIKDQVPPRF